MQPSKAAVRLGILLLALAICSPVYAEVIPAGVDLWATAAGRTHTSFEPEPIPAGFFCEGSKPFTGRIAFRGEPLKVEPAGSLDGADTIVSRLDDAVFNGKGEASTRIQLLALSLAGVAPVEIEGCGKYDVQARLWGEQPITDMRILRAASNGGSYVAPLSLNVQLIFTPLNGDPMARRTLTRNVILGPSSSAVWTYTTAPRYKGRIMVDTDGDLEPDTVLPKASNFFAGISPASSGGSVAVESCTMGTNATSCPPGYCLHKACHCNPVQRTWDPYDPGTGCTYLHCLWVCVPAGGGTTGTSPGSDATAVCAAIEAQ
jgi:hypothetical protein